MDDPVAEIRDVIRSITEPYSAVEIANNVEKYFTEDAYIIHPLLNQPHTQNGRQRLKGIYKMLRVLSINQHIEFHGVMFSEDKTQATIGMSQESHSTMLDADREFENLTEHMQLPRFLPFKLTVHPRFITLIKLRKEQDGKWRISRQWDNFPSDLGLSGWPLPGFIWASNTYKVVVGTLSGALGSFLLSNRLLGE